MLLSLPYPLGQPRITSRSHSGAAISMHTPGRLPLYRQGAVTTETGGESPRGGPRPQHGSHAHLQTSKVEQPPAEQERNAGESRRASVPARLLLPPPNGAVPSPSNSKTKRKAPRPTEEMTQDAGRRRSKEGTVDSRSAMAYAGSTLPRRPRLTKSFNSALLKGALPPPSLEPSGAGVTAPPLPPRKHQRNHSRSSSLDLNLVFQDGKRS